MKIIVLGVDALKGKPAQGEEKRFPFAVTEAVALLIAKDDIELAVVASKKIELIARKDAEAVQASVGVVELPEAQRGGR